MKVIVTCGPSFEPIDEVRRLTNFSTGELGALLAEQLAAAGHEVFCFKGSGATHAGPTSGPRCQVRRFDTNDDLLALLREVGGAHEVGAVFHAAALCDFRVATVRDAAGDACSSAKIASRAGALTLHLEPATKVIHELRPLFPRSLLVGWKYELAGTREEALAKAHRQLSEAQTDLCVLNGRAAGEGFSICDGRSEVSQWPTKAALCAELVQRLAR
ncbi:MAG: DNA/pantothenate metabolism flavoprotein domain protein [Pedosphaera sp. Tous-C6FEB]|nr:MAG: DNA/pantothenate metabolism flavoprotein domain protein [Pedosphaera sp. Tous-C6FEB]